MLAGITKVPEFELAKDEAEKLGKSVAEVAKHYNFNATPKQLAWFNLALCGGSIYGSRIFMYNSRVKETIKKKKNAANGTVEVDPVATAPASDIFKGVAMPNLQ